MKMFTCKRFLFFLIIVRLKSFCYVFDVNYSYKYETNNTGYTAMLLQKQQNGFRLVAGAPKFDTVTICNPACQSYTYSEKNPAGIELLGAVIDGGDKVDDPLYVCAPKYTTTPQYRANGRCFAWNDHFKSINSLSNPLLQVQLYNSSYEFFYAHGQAGFSIKYIDGTEFLIGAPGVLSWKGTVIKHTTYDSKDILTVEKRFERHSYLGYAIEYDTFYFNYLPKRCVIAGAPRGNDLRGMILKPQKTRKPLCDVDLGTEDSDDTTAAINKSSRRVSFASNNFVKPFVTDPEKNTIWDQTYEEAIEQSDTSPSIYSSHGERNENDPNGLNVTRMDNNASDMDFTLPVDGIMEGAAIINKSTADGMDFTTALTNVCFFKANNVANKGTMMVDMELTAVVDSLKGDEGGVARHTIIDDDNMEFTTPIQVDLNPIRANSDLLAEQTADDTEKLINLDLNGEKSSDFTKVITGDLLPPFPKLKAMPLRGINSTSFVQDYISEAKTQTSRNDQSVEDMEISLADDNANPEIIVTSPTGINEPDVDDMDITQDEYTNAASKIIVTNHTDAKIEATDEKVEDKEPPNTDLTKSDDTTALEEGSIVELCTKLTMENTTLLCDTSVVSNLADFSDEEITNASNSGSTDTATAAFGTDNNSPLIDWSRMHAIMRKSEELNEKITKYNERVQKEVEEEAKIMVECIDEVKRKCKLLDEFDALVAKWEEIKNTEYSEESAAEPEKFTWKEKILKLAEENDGCWDIVTLDDSRCKFTTLYGTIGLNVDMDIINGQVKEIEFEDHISSESEPIALYIHKIFMEKLKLEHIRSALGEKFDILSLLDYVRLTMEKLIVIDHDYTWLSLKYGASIDENFRISFALISVNLMFSWVFTIDVTDYDNINKDTVSYYARVGDLRERDIQKCLNSCPKGFGFVRASIETLYKWLEDLERKVVIFDYDYIQDFVLKILYGDQIGSYFGSSLLATSSGLLIGAPMYTTKSYEEGCVYVYNNDYQVDIVLSQKICGQHVGGRFGTAMAKIGSRHKAVAISAPYADEGVGIVYIYFKDGNDYEKVQEISGKSVPGILMGFGLSVSRGLDIDDNGENDIAIGSLYSNHMIVLRSRKVITLTHLLTSPFDKIAPGTKNLHVTYCFSYAATDGEIDIVISAETDDRAAIKMNKSMRVAISNQSRCEDFLLALKSHAFDSPQPLKVKVTQKLIACPECPVLFHKRPTTVTHEIPFITGCGDDNICEPNLKLVAKFVNTTELTMGTRDSVQLLVSLANLGETAYHTHLNITLPVEISKFPVTCSKVENVIHCKIPNRLTSNIIKEFVFHFDVKSLNPRVEKLEINITADSSGTGNGRSQSTTVTLPVVLKSNVTLIGFSPHEYLENKDGVNFTHEYMVFNSGPSPLLQEILEFDVPESILTPTGGSVDVFVISPLADECFPTGEPPTRNAREVTKAKQAAVDIPDHVKYRFDCRNNSLVVCKKYRCLIGELAANTSLKFKILMEVKASLIYDVLGDKLEGKSLFLIQSVATFIDSFKRQKEIHVSTVLFRRMVEEANIWMWVIIAVIGSILILTVLIAILFKLNFFARPMREKMKMEEENKNERECIISNDENTEENPEVFSDIRF